VATVLVLSLFMSSTLATVSTLGLGHCKGRRFCLIGAGLVSLVLVGGGWWKSPSNFLQSATMASGGGHQIVRVDFEVFGKVQG
jgi:hypothetical protein